MTSILRSSFAFSLVLLIAACDSGGGDDGGDGAPATEVLASVNVDGAQADFVDAAFPEAEGGEPAAVSGSAQIVRGGSIILAVEVAEEVDRVLIGIDGDYAGYFAVDVATPTFTLVATSESESSITDFTLLVATETDGTVSEVTQHTLTVNQDAGTSSQLQVSLNWDAAVDLDLHLETPDGEDIFYGNRTGSQGGELDLDSNAACSLDRVDNENITWVDDQTPPPGDYIVRVDLWSACDVTEDIPFVVTVRSRGEVSTFEGTFEPSEADGGGSHDGRVITEFTFESAALRAGGAAPAEINPGVNSTPTLDWASTKGGNAAGR